MSEGNNAELFYSFFLFNFAQICSLCFLTPFNHITSVSTRQMLEILEDSLNILTPNHYTICQWYMGYIVTIVMSSTDILLLKFHKILDSEKKKKIILLDAACERLSSNEIREKNSERGLQIDECIRIVHRQTFLLR